MLYAKETPSFGGDTQFANMYLAYEALSPGMKKMFKSIKTYNVGDGNKRRSTYSSRNDRYKGGQRTAKEATQRSQKLTPDIR